MADCTASPNNNFTRWQKVLLLVLGGAVLAVGWGLFTLGKMKDAAANSRLESVTIVVLHPQFPEFSETHTLHLGDEEIIHDTEYSLRLVDFVPDFQIDKKTKQVVSRSANLNNPALKLEIYPTVKKDPGQWIFRDTDMEHQVPAPGFTFRVEAIKLRQRR